MTTNNSTPQTDPKRLRVLTLLKAGLITHAEAAELLDTSRQAVRYWCLREGVDAPLARHKYLKQLFAKRDGDPA